MGYEPTTYCKLCNEPFDAYVAPEERICSSCIEIVLIEHEEMANALKFIAQSVHLPTCATVMGKGECNCHVAVAQSHLPAPPRRR